MTPTSLLKAISFVCNSVLLDGISSRPHLDGVNLHDESVLRDIVDSVRTPPCTEPGVVVARIVQRCAEYVLGLYGRTVEIDVVNSRTPTAAAHLRRSTWTRYTFVCLKCLLCIVNQESTEELFAECIAQWRRAPATCARAVNALLNASGVIHNKTRLFARSISE